MKLFEASHLDCNDSQGPPTAPRLRHPLCCVPTTVNKGPLYGPGLTPAPHNQKTTDAGSCRPIGAELEVEGQPEGSQGWGWASALPQGSKEPGGPRQGVAFSSPLGEGRGRQRKGGGGKGQGEGWAPRHQGWELP